MKAARFKLPSAPPKISKGCSLSILLDKDAINCMANNFSAVHKKFDKAAFKKLALNELDKKEIMQRGHHLSHVFQKVLPSPYSKSVRIILQSLTEPLKKTEQNGLGVFFYLPHTLFVSNYGLDPKFNNSEDPFDISMLAQYELTRRFTAEYSVRSFIIEQQDRTLDYLYGWLKDPCPHVRRLCSEGSRPRLPWALRIHSLVRDPTPTLKILEKLKDDPVLYVRRSVANHIGDIAKDHPEFAVDLCRSWLKNASLNRRWLIRHALRYLAKKNYHSALKVRKMAG